MFTISAKLAEEILITPGLNLLQSVLIKLTTGKISITTSSGSILRHQGQC